MYKQLDDKIEMTTFNFVSNKKKMIKPQTKFTKCNCTESIKYNSKLYDNKIYKRAKIIPNVVIRDYDVNTTKVYRIVDLDPTDLNNTIYLKCTCKNWNNDAIKYGVFASFEEIQIKREIQRNKRQQ